jgi:cobalamin biosynthesis Mg chelatase CobN
LLADKKGADDISAAGQAATAKDGVSTGIGGDTSTSAGSTGGTGFGDGSTNISVTAATTDSSGISKSTSAAVPEEAAIPKKTAVSDYGYIMCGIAVFSAVLCIYIARRAARQDSCH